MVITSSRGGVAGWLWVMRRGGSTFYTKVLPPPSPHSPAISCTGYSPAGPTNTSSLRGSSTLNEAVAPWGEAHDAGPPCLAMLPRVNFLAETVGAVCGLAKYRLMSWQECGGVCPSSPPLYSPQVAGCSHYHVCGGGGGHSGASTIGWYRHTHPCLLLL